MEYTKKSHIVFGIIVLISIITGICINIIKNKQPLVSVIIAAYNHEKYVTETIDSIVAQTYPNLELIVIDDGSKDNTYKILQEVVQKHKKRFKRIVLKTQENQGTTTTLNRLIAETKGKYVFMIASDDVAKPECIEKEVTFLEKNPDYVIAVGDNEFINYKSKRIYLTEDEEETDNINLAKYKTFADKVGTREFHHTYAVLWSGHSFYTNGYTIRSSILKRIPPFTKEAPLEDYYMFLQLLKYGKMKFIDEILFSYRIHAAQTSKNKEKINDMTIKTRLYEVIFINSLANYDGMLSSVKLYIESKKI